MVPRRTSAEIKAMHEAGKLLSQCHKEIRKRIKPGILTKDIDDFVDQYLSRHGATPEQKGYNGYPYATCASVNDVVCHGFPSKSPLKDGDIVTIDMVVNLNGWLADSAWSYRVGNVSDEAETLLNTTKEALYIGIEQAKVGNRIGHIANAIQSFAEQKGYSVVKDFIGHGIGRKIHESPIVPHFGPIEQGPVLEEGMVITIEPMLNCGAHFVYVEEDGWTARTVDGSLSAQYEHTVAITSDGPMILTEQNK
ncbi:type I methionyl aminopeptidase [Pseudalkalibacillus berkeleyi]|uniref:Methionine aminopeptidase n=1 Tax=Pseudalkalibacillus berkeleyi TaxID=1069813 RepID=A0ABS9GY60_9BACL|nr:type I methionyl aminopeptidase [Pseudalkalibacillus berkeleyi]MCF6136756.1 type I methionyl aminopeptidase [Pseudalkalibacillus berkeleyi]